ncbi:MAG: proline--tRNA ligase [Candidatus Pacearchaeota archaeon]
MAKNKEGLTVKKSEDISEWYTEIIQKAELADYAPVKGFMIIRPNAYSIWEKIQKYFNDVLKKLEVKNAYFPLLIPESFFKKEAEHAKGFSPELAYIKNSGKGEKLALRPTSETIIYDSYSKWIRSHRDLPLKINQWCNVIRWEVKQTKPFLRTREFLWQEGHNVFETEKEAEKDMTKMIHEYKKLLETQLAIPVLTGLKSNSETFAGAKKTMTIEALMPDGKCLQCGTSHNLGQNFSKSFKVSFKNENEEDQYAWQTSWGFSTRLIGALIMIHGDDKGLVLPPKVAENKIVVVPILFEKTKSKTLKKAKEISKKLKKFNPFLDDREEYSPGWKFNEWELKGIPLRIEIGPKDIANKQVVVVRRDTGTKEIVKERNLKNKIPEILEEIQKSLFKKAKKFLDENIVEANSIKELKSKIKEGKIVKAYFSNNKETEKLIKDFTDGATSRIVKESTKLGKCIQTGKKTNTLGYFAKSY